MFNQILGFKRIHNILYCSLIFPTEILQALHIKTQVPVTSNTTADMSINARGHAHRTQLTLYWLLTYDSLPGLIGGIKYQISSSTTLPSWRVNNASERSLNFHLIIRRPCLASGCSREWCQGGGEGVNFPTLSRPSITYTPLIPPSVEALLVFSQLLTPRQNFERSLLEGLRTEEYFLKDFLENVLYCCSLFLHGLIFIFIYCTTLVYISSLLPFGNLIYDNYEIVSKLISFHTWLSYRPKSSCFLLYGH